MRYKNLRFTYTVLTYLLLHLYIAEMRVLQVTRFNRREVTFR